MFSLSKFSKTLKPLIPVISTRSAGSKSLEELKPKPYPKTQKEREEAARKYGLEIEEYEPYPDDGSGYGDYPKLPLVCANEKNPNYPYDYPGHKRNFNEPLHVYAVFTNDRCMYEHGRQRLTRWQLFRALLMFMSVSIGLVYLSQLGFVIIRPIAIKQDPFATKTHYTFEIDSS